jgi:hypothetical protein
MAMGLCEWLVVPLLVRSWFIRQVLMKRPGLAASRLTVANGGIHHLWAEPI